jgi:hypothetical protein
VFFSDRHFQPCLMFVGKARSGALERLGKLGQAPDLPSNIILASKVLVGTNTPAYNEFRESRGKKFFYHCPVALWCLKTMNRLAGGQKL